jgi:hypothetical protein
VAREIDLFQPPVLREDFRESSQGALEAYKIQAE